MVSSPSHRSRKPFKLNRDRGNRRDSLDRFVTDGGVVTDGQCHEGLAMMMSAYCGVLLGHQAVQRDSAVTRIGNATTEHDAFGRENRHVISCGPCAGVDVKSGTAKTAPRSALE